MAKDTITCPLKDKLCVTGRTWTRVGWQFHRQCIEQWISALKWQSQGLLLSLSVVSDSLWPHGLQHTGFLVHHHLPELISVESLMRSNHLILYCLLLLLPSIFPSIRAFPVSQFFTSSGQSIGVSASALVLPMNIQDWFPLELTGWISLKSKVP